MKTLWGFLAIGISLGGFLPVFGFEPEAMNCTVNDLDYVKFLYKSNIDGINEALQLYKQSHPNYNMQSLVGYMYNPFLNKASDSAKCLEDLGVDPLSVAQLSSDAQQVFNYDHERLSKMAPLFVQYVPIPEFQLSIPILLVGLGFLIFYPLKFRTR
ncbi:MAG: hypothetical protein KGI25_04310 [Thaumarchaeota archaeon]|nr:hypothetical protein [Nitrososphaerota archaeon]